MTEGKRLIFYGLQHACLQFAHLFGRPGDSEVIFFQSFESSCQLLLPANHSKFEAQCHNKQTYLVDLHTHYPFDAERQAGKL